MKDYWKSRYDRSADRFAALDLQSIDRVAELCCGNGLITRAVAARVEQITGADYYRYDCLIQRSDPNSTDKRGRA
jgi:predicted TPR repeat methyltransferase